MDIYTHLIEKYCKKNNQPVTISFNISPDTITPEIKITRGEYEQNGSRVEFLDFDDIREILIINDIVNFKGENSLVKEELDNFSNELSSGKGNVFNRLENVESLVYDTLAKYIIQMLNGSATLQIIYPELIPLEKHKAIYFRTE